MRKQKPIHAIQSVSDLRKLSQFFPHGHAGVQSPASTLQLKRTHVGTQNLCKNLQCVSQSHPMHECMVVCATQRQVSRKGVACTTESTISPDPAACRAWIAFTLFPEFQGDPSQVSNDFSSCVILLPSKTVEPDMLHMHRVRAHTPLSARSTVQRGSFFSKREAFVVRDDDICGLCVR